MNAATRVSASSTLYHRSREQAWTWEYSLLLGLIILVFISAFAVVYVRDYQRQLITDVQTLQIEHDNMLTQRGQLLLEQAAWSTQTHVQQVAQTQLGMVYPQQAEMVILEE